MRKETESGRRMERNRVKGEECIERKRGMTALSDEISSNLIKCIAAEILY